MIKTWMICFLISCFVLSGCKVRIIVNQDLYDYLTEEERQRFVPFQPVNTDTSQYSAYQRQPTWAYYLNAQNLQAECAKRPFTWVMFIYNECQTDVCLEPSVALLRYIPLIDSLARLNQLSPYLLNSHFNNRGLSRFKQIGVYKYHNYVFDDQYGRKGHRKLRQLTAQLGLKTKSNPSMAHLIFNQQGKLLLYVEEKTYGKEQAASAKAAYDQIHAILTNR
jgi:hypothetical protein